MSHNEIEIVLDQEKLIIRDQLRKLIISSELKRQGIHDADSLLFDDSSVSFLAMVGRSGIMHTKGRNAAQIVRTHTSRTGYSVSPVSMGTAGARSIFKVSSPSNDPMTRLIDPDDLGSLSFQFGLPDLVKAGMLLHHVYDEQLLAREMHSFQLAKLGYVFLALMDSQIRFSVEDSLGRLISIVFEEQFQWLIGELGRDVISTPSSYQVATGAFWNRMSYSFDDAGYYVGVGTTAVSSRAVIQDLDEFLESPD